MSKMRRSPHGRNGRYAGTGRRRAPEPLYDPGEDVQVSSVLFGLAMMVAIIVSAAAWMGGSISKVENGVANSMDGFARSVGLSVENIVIYGLEADAELERLVRGAAMIEPGENMWRADPYAIRGRIEATRRVENVRVHRLWPGQVVILADRSEPVALFNDGQRWAVIDAKGRTLPGEAPENYLHLVKVAGEGAPGAVSKLIESVASSPELASRIAYATRVAERRWDLSLISGVVVRMPGDERLAQAVATLAAVDARVSLTQRSASVLDLRAEDHLFITPAKNAAPGGNA